MINLPEITIVCVSSIRINESIDALRYSCKDIRFGQVLFLSDVFIEKKGITYKQIPKITSINDYNIFILKHLIDYIDTDYVLIIQWDGFVINAGAWNRDFLNYDYIGAVWSNPTFLKKPPLVGNGGFSLRSKRLMKAVQGLDYANFPEDVFICQVHRKLLMTLGMKFADVKTARHFSFEQILSPYETFGFHKGGASKNFFNNIKEIIKEDDEKNI